MTGFRAQSRKRSCRFGWLLPVAIFLPAAGAAQGPVARTIDALPPATPAAQNAINVQAPVIGFAATDNGSALQPIFGIPGASLLGPAVTLPSQTQRIAVAPPQTFALIESSNATEIGLLPLAAFGVGTIHPISGTLPHPDLIRFSPGALSAVLYSKQLAVAQVVTGLPASPQAGAQLSLSTLQEPVTALAVSDDGKVVLAGTSSPRRGAPFPRTARVPEGQEGEITLFFDGKISTLTTGLGAPSSLKFLPQSYVAFLTDSQLSRLLALGDVTGTVATRVLASEDDGLNAPRDFEISPDQTELFVANSGSKALLAVGISTSERVSIPCPVVPSTIVRVSANPVYLISSATGAFAVMQSGPGSTQVSFVPAAIASTGQPLQ